MLFIQAASPIQLQGYLCRMACPTPVKSVTHRLMDPANKARQIPGSSATKGSVDAENLLFILPGIFHFHEQAVSAFGHKGLAA